MPERFEYPSPGWSTGRMRKVGERPDNSNEASVQQVSDNTISQHKAELEDLAGQWSTGEISSKEFNTAIGARGWTAINVPGSPRKMVEGWHQNMQNISRDLVKSTAFMKELYRGVIYLMDPRKQVHEIKVGEEEQ